MQNSGQNLSSNIESPFKPLSTPVKQQKQTNSKQILHFSINDDLKNEKQINQESQKFSMADLCKSFLKKHDNRQYHTFTTLQIINDFKVKQRRIYDLMNILQGCGRVGKISKGTYQWFAKERFIDDNENGDSTSLRQISAKLKLILFKLDKPISFNQLNQIFLNDKIQRKINPASIRRRIYQCCKVFTLLGYIYKTGNQFYTTFSNLQSPLSTPVTRKTKLKKSKFEVSQNKLIAQILKNYQTMDQIEEFIIKIKRAYQQKYSIIKRQ